MPYELLNRIGRGGFADVYEAQDFATGELFAVKVLVKRHGDHRENQQWQQVRQLAWRGEGQILPRLDHVSVQFNIHLCMLEASENRHS